MKSSPLNHIKIASPCQADWDEMLGDKRQRYCLQCKLNVYNLSEMTEHEAENLLFETEGRICVRLYRRKDGTVITQDCPVGWQAMKQKVSRVATAAFGLMVGFFVGLYGYSQLFSDSAKLLEEVKIDAEKSNNLKSVVTQGVTLPAKKARDSQKPSPKEPIEFAFYGGISNQDELMWLFTERYPK